MKTLNIYSLTAAPIALAAAMMFASPAKADVTPECNTTPTGVNNTECGALSTAGPNGATAVGVGATANGTDAVAIGSDDAGAAPTRAVGAASTAVGGEAQAVGAGATAFGWNSEALDVNTTAVGNSATASGANGIAVGTSSVANSDGSIAIGSQASASAVDSVAIGANSVADQENTVSFGVVGRERRLVNVAAGTADTDAVNVGQLNSIAAGLSGSAATAQATADTAIARGDMLGTDTAAALGGNSTYDAATGRVSAPSYVMDGQSYSNVGAALSAVDDRLVQVETRIDTLLASNDRRFRHANGGVAAAMAMGGTMIVPDSTVSMSFNLATYRGEQGFSGAVVVRASPRVYVSGGFAGSTVKGSTGGRVGVAFGF